MRIDRIVRMSLLVLGLTWLSPLWAAAAEHGGAGMKEHGGTAVEAAAPTPEALRQAIRDHIARQAKEKGAFTVVDERTGQARQLELVQVHERVGKTGDYYYSCADLKDVKTGDLLDLDFDVQGGGGELKVVAVRIHKDNGNPRYTYDENDRRVPVQR